MDQQASPGTEQHQSPCCGGPDLLKRSLLLFWAVWFTIVFLTNALDAAKAAGWLDESWALASGNYGFITATTAHYGTPSWMNALMFAGVILWEGLAALLFWRAGFKSLGKAGQSARYAAYTTALLLWAAFMIADEIFIAYQVEAAHVRLFIAQLATLLAVEWIGD